MIKAFELNNQNVWGQAVLTVGCLHILHDELYNIFGWTTVQIKVLKRLFILDRDYFPICIDKSDTDLRGWNMEDLMDFSSKSFPVRQVLKSRTIIYLELQNPER
jgi:hypothetical protein